MILTENESIKYKALECSDGVSLVKDNDSLYSRVLVFPGPGDQVVCDMTTGRIEVTHDKQTLHIEVD